MAEKIFRRTSYGGEQTENQKGNDNDVGYKLSFSFHILPYYNLTEIY